MKASFPADWPHRCPPSDAGEASGVVYRIIKQRSPSTDDFRSHRELQKLPDADPCLRCGLSLFRRRLDAVHQANLFPRLGRFLASGELAPRHGRTMLTGGKFPSHTTWWIYDGVDRPEPFAYVEEVR